MAADTVAKRLAAMDFSYNEGAVAYPTGTVSAAERAHLLEFYTAGSVGAAAVRRDRLLLLKVS